MECSLSHDLEQLMCNPAKGIDSKEDMEVQKRFNYSTFNLIIIVSKRDLI